MRSRLKDRHLLSPSSEIPELGLAHGFVSISGLIKCPTTLHSFMYLAIELCLFQMTYLALLLGHLD